VPAASPVGKTVRVHDVTLRDGEGTPGVSFGARERVEIARQLDALGVQRIEAGQAGSSDEDRAAVRKVAALGLRATVMVWSGPTRAELEEALASGAEGVVLGVPITPNLLDESSFVHASADALRFLKDRDVAVAFFPWDTTRVQLHDALRLLGEVFGEVLPDSIAVVDTRGIATPEGMAQLVTAVRALAPIPVEVHCHNDLGLGVANAIAGVLAGAEVVHTAMSSLGERCGNTPTEALVLALELLYDIDTGMSMELLHEAAELVSRHAAAPIPRNQPVVGEFAFVRATETSAAGTLDADPTVLFPYDPGLVGRKGRIEVGKLSGTAVVGHKLRSVGLEATDAEVGKVAGLARVKAAEEKRLLAAADLRELLDHIRLQGGTHG
jgi:isopropylmalate/homocitrate/citramalate synthase